jgi:hypothetical protein
VSPRPASDTDACAISLLALWVGLYLLLGALVAFATAQWPFFMPEPVSEIDAFLRLFGDAAPALLGGASMAILGAACCGLSIRALARDRHRRRAAAFPSRTAR